MTSIGLLAIRVVELEGALKDVLQAWNNGEEPSDARQRGIRAGSYAILKNRNFSLPADDPERNRATWNRAIKAALEQTHEGTITHALISALLWPEIVANEPSNMKVMNWGGALMDELPWPEGKTRNKSRK